LSLKKRVTGVDDIRIHVDMERRKQKLMMSFILEQIIYMKSQTDVFKGVSNL